MGLAAQQCRLLTITGRKSDCEYQSMALSNQKISLSRNMADISNEYENSLNLTKLVYDYYGTGDTTNQVSYNLLMMPSALNNYLPITVTDPRGRVMLDSRLAQAARAAGIPEEGVNGLPSDITRNAFLEAMFGVGMISSQSQLTAIENIPYDQSAGFGDLGGINGTITQTTTGNKQDLINALKNSATSKYKASDIKNQTDMYGQWIFENNKQVDFSNSSLVGDSYTLADLLTKNVAVAVESKYWNQIGIENYDKGDDFSGQNSANAAMNRMIMDLGNNLTSQGGFIDWMYDAFANVLDTGDGYSSNALNYALMKVKDLVTYDPSAVTYNGGDVDYTKGQTANQTSSAAVFQVGNMAGRKDETENKAVNNLNQQKLQDNYNGIVAVRPWHDNDKDQRAAASINLSNLANSFLTYYATYMDGLSTDTTYNAGKGLASGQNFVTNDLGYRYTMYAGQLDTSAAGQALYYDTLFNQICSGGWLENDNITDNKYLQNMLQNGMAFITKPSDDGYYYQGNYSTDSYIKEVTDDSAIAKAEAKYNTEKAKLDSKEQVLDLKMKNLDTEISALTTEYDSVKSVISKNIEKAFKRYNA